MDTLTTFFNWLLDVIKNVLLWFLEPIYKVLQSVFYFIVDAVLTIIESIFQSIDFTASLFHTGLSLAGLPTQAIWLLNELYFAEGLFLVTTAVGVRLILNLIPSWATRV